jgi:hypothetical protein
MARSGSTWIRGRAEAGAGAVAASAAAARRATSAVRVVKCMTGVVAVSAKRPVSGE